MAETAIARKGDRNNITPEYLRERLSYDPETGRLFWLDHEAMPRKWRTRYVGNEAFKTPTVAGYRQGAIDGIMLAAHRVVWAICNGEWPTNDIDHINGVRSDNRIANLRDVPHRTNQRNMRRHRSNTSGVVGVNYHKRDKAFRAFIEIDGRSLHLGNFKSFDEAVAARKAAETHYGFHRNHGN